MRYLLALIIVVAMCAPAFANDSIYYVNAGHPNARNWPDTPTHRWGRSADTPWITPSYALSQAGGSAANHDTMMIYGYSIIRPDTTPALYYQDFLNLGTPEYWDFVGVSVGVDSPTFSRNGRVFESGTYNVRTGNNILKGIRFYNIRNMTDDLASIFYVHASSANINMSNCIVDSITMKSSVYAAAFAVQASSADTNLITDCVFQNMNYSAFGIYKSTGSFSAVNGYFEHCTFRNAEPVNVESSYNMNVRFNNCIIDSSLALVAIADDAGDPTINLIYSYSDTYSVAATTRFTTGSGATINYAPVNFYNVDPQFVDALADNDTVPGRILGTSPCATLSATGGYIGYWNPGGSGPAPSTASVTRLNWLMRWRPVLWRL